MSEDLTEMDRIVEMMNKRGHAHEFAAYTPADRRVMEKLTAQEWVDAMRETFHIEISHLSVNEQHDADCSGRYKDRTISIELTELVNSEILNQIDRARKQGRHISASDALFDKAQWTPELFKSKIEERLDAKHENYISQRPSRTVDILVIHTAEPWLSPYQVQEWLKGMTFQPRCTLKSAYLLMRYFPRFSDCWPLFNLYGEP